MMRPAMHTITATDTLIRENGVGAFALPPDAAADEPSEPPSRYKPPVALLELLPAAEPLSVAVDMLAVTG